MKFKTNFIIKIVAALLALLLFIIVISSISSDSSPNTGTQQAADADTAEDTLRSLTAELQEYQAQLSESEQQNNDLIQEFEQLKEVIEGTKNNAPEAIDKEQIASDIMKQVINLLPDNNEEQPTFNPEDFNVNQSVGPRRYRSIHLTDQEASEGFDSSLETSFGNIRGNTTEIVNNGLNPSDENEVEPFITIPANTTVWDAVALTTLLGRVPVGGDVADPAPFKVLLSAENLAANGHQVPGLQGTIVSGHAIGDGTLSCLYGIITSLTFIFDNGSIVNHTGQGNAGTDLLNPAEAGSRNTGIGYLSDQHGNQCIPGKYFSNLPQQLLTVGAFGAAAGAAEAFVSNETFNATSLDSSVASQVVTGDRTNVLLGNAVNNSVEDISDFFLSQQPDRWESVVVRAGSPVVIHINQDIPLDHDPTNRRVQYAETEDSPSLF